MKAHTARDMGPLGSKEGKAINPALKGSLRISAVGSKCWTSKGRLV